MKLYPKLYCKKVTDIDINFLLENNIKALILDVDNTLIDFDKNLLQGIHKWYETVTKNGIKCIILSNSHNLNKVKNVAKSIGIPFIYFATKPLKRGFKKAKEQLNVSSENIAVIGDQIFTDVIGANRCGMLPILVEPIAEKDIWITKLKRPLENYIIKKYLEKEKKRIEKNVF